MTNDELIDAIYEAAALPDLWSNVLTKINRIGDGYFTLLFVAGRQGQGWVLSGGAEERATYEEYLAGGWPQKTDREKRLLAARHAGFLRDLDVYSIEDLERDAFWEFCRPRGFGWGAATIIPVPTGDVLVFDIERRYETGPVEVELIQRLDILRPHLARASLVSARLALQRAHAATATLEALGIPGAVLDRSSRIMSANPLLERLMPTVVQDRTRRVTFVDASADTLLSDALGGLKSPGYLSGAKSIPIAAREQHPPYVAHIVPVRLSAQDVFSSADALLILTPVVPSEVPTAEVLQGLFDLTAAEARVARGIVECQGVDGIALAAGTSKDTVRTQLKAVFAKTGTSRQIDLMSLLAGKQISGADQEVE